MLAMQSDGQLLALAALRSAERFGELAEPMDASASLPALQPLHLIDEITHRVVNEYTEAICGLGLAAAATSSVQAKAALSAAANRLRDQVEAHRALQSPFAEGSIDLAGYLGAVCGRLARSPLAEAGVRLEVKADEVWLDAQRSWRVGLIVAELVRNALRHGLRNRPGRVRVDISENAGGINCWVTDDGVGAIGARVGRGRRLVQALAAELGGSVHWSFTPAGCSVHLTFPACPGSLIDPGPRRGETFRSDDGPVRTFCSSPP